MTLDVLVIGQAPAGGPPGPAFASRSGDALRRWFKEAGIDYENLEIEYTNIGLTYPGKTGGGKYDLMPPKESVTDGTSRVRRMLKDRKPKVVVTVGTVAATAMYRSGTLEQIVGKSIRLTGWGFGTTVISLPHIRHEQVAQRSCAHGSRQRGARSPEEDRSTKVLVPCSYGKSPR